jgi:hypothetical protein
VAFAVATARAASPSPPADVRTKAEVVATRPPDGEHRYPLELESLVPLGDFDLVVSTHAGRDRGKDIGIWAPVDGGWRRIRRFVNEEPEVGEYEAPIAFHYDGDFFVYVSFVQSGSGGAHEDTLLVVERDAAGQPTLANVSIEEPEKRFRPQLHAGEGIWKDTSITLADEKLEWEFGIWKPEDPICCPTAGRMRGTFAIEKDDGVDCATHRSVETWRMVVRDGKRVPIE